MVGPKPSQTHVQVAIQIVKPATGFYKMNAQVVRSLYIEQSMVRTVHVWMVTL